MGRRLVLLPLLGLLALGYAAKCPKQRTSPGREILCYTSTNEVETLEDSICRCTTLVHQGHDLQDLSTSGIEELQKSLKELNPVLQFVLSINDKQGSLKTSARVRQEAAARIVRILNEVDGIELNVTAGTKERLVHFVQGLQTEMVRKSKEKRILLVLPTKPQDLAKQFDIKGLSKYVDLFTIPTHYLIDDDEAYKTFHPSRLMGLFDMLNTDSLVDLVTGLGAGKRKIVISLPASAYKFILKNSEENTPRAQTKEIQPVPISRLELCEAMEKGEWIVERDEDLTAPYAFKDDTWIAFEDKISAGIKGKYALLRDLAGLGIHNVERDSKTKCGISLTEEIYHSFTDNKRKTREAVLTSLQEDMRQTHNSYSNHVKSSEFRIVRVVDTDGHVHANRENMQTEFSCIRQGYFVHPKSCNRFYRCVKFNQGVEDYSVFEFDCPAGLVFDEHAEVCVWPGSMEGSACPGSSEIAPSKGPKFTCPDQPGYYADPQNCRFFYACYDLGEHELTAYEFTCPYGLVFDEKKLICEWPYLVPSCGGGTYQRNDYGGHSGEISGHGGNAGHGDGHMTVNTGHGGSSGHDGSSGGGEHGGSSSGGYDESGHGSEDSGHGGYDDSGHTTVHSGYGGDAAHGGSSGGGYDNGHTTVHSGYGGGAAHGGSSGGGYDNGHTTVHSGYGGGAAHGGSSGGGYDNGHTTIHSGYGGGVTHGGSSGGGYDNGHTTVHSGYGGSAAHGGSSGGGYDNGHTTVHSGYGGGAAHGGSSGGGYDNGHTTIHSGYGGGVTHGESSGGGYDSGHTTVHSGYGGGITHGESSEEGHGNSHTTVHSGYGGGVINGGSSGGGYDSGHTTGHSGYDGGSSGGGHDSGQTTVHSGYDGGVVHGGSGGGYDSGHTTVNSGYGGGVIHGGSSGGGYDSGHTTVHSGYGGGVTHGESSEGGHGNSHTTVHSGYDGGVAHGGSSGGGYNSGHTTIHSGYGGGVTHGESSEEGHGNSHTTVHSGYGGGVIHGGSSEGGYDSGHTTGHSGHDGGSSGGGHDSGQTTVHSGYNGGVIHGGSSGGGYDSGHTTVHSGYGGGVIDGGSSGGDYDNGHTTINSGYGGGVIHGGSSGGGYDSGHTTVHAGYGGGVTHGVTFEGDYGNSHTTVHSGYDGGVGHGGSSGGGHDSGHTIINGVSSGIGYTASSQNGHGEASHGGYEGSSGSIKGEYTKAQEGHTGYSQAPGIGIFTGPVHSSSASDGTYSGESHSNGYSGHSGTSGGISGTKNSFDHGYKIDSANAGYTDHDAGVHTGINSGVYDGHTPIIQYGGQTGSAATHGIDHSTGIGGSLNSGSTGSTTYHGNFRPGGITSGSATQGVIGTADSISGTVYTHGDVSGTVLTGKNEQGKVISGITQPGYVQTHSGTPGYVVSNGAKTTYDDYNSKGTFEQGIGGHGVILTSPGAPGVDLTGHSSPGTYLTGQNAPGVIHGGAVTPGISIGGSSGGQYYTGGSGTSIYNGAGGSVTSGQESYDSAMKKSNLPKNPFITVGKDMGYKTNEYHDNGGRGTIRYNNGEITHKYTEDDVKDHHTQFGTLPTFDAGSYKTMPGTFTKTGPTKTGITTAQLGGSASYVAATSKPRPFSTAQNIGANAFSSSSDYSDASSKISNDRTYGSSTSSPDLGYTSTRPDYDSGNVDISKINLGSTKSNSGQSSFGYSYTKPAIQLDIFGVRGSTKAPSSPIRQESPVYSTSPAPYLDVHVYNNPSIVTSAPVTAAPALVNSYTYSKPSNAANLPSSSTGVDSTGIYARPSLNTERKPFPSLPSTVSPIAFTTGPLENFKTTVFEAARIPGSISTVQPVIDTGYKTVVSPTRYPINVNTNSFGYKQNNDYRTDSLSTKDKSALDINISFERPHLSTQGQYENVDTVAPAILVESGYNKSRRPSVTQTVTYERPATQTKYGSTGSSDYSESNDYSDYTHRQTGGSFGQKISQGSSTPTAIYNTPTYSPKIYNVPTSTIAPAIGVTYRQPFQVVTSRPIARIPSEGYNYSKPSVKFPSSTAPSITYKNPNIDEYESQTTKNGASPTNLDIPRKEVEKLITNYDRGSAKFTPSVYDTYTGDRREETTLNIGGYNRQQSYSSSSRDDGKSHGSGKISSTDKSDTYGRVPSTTPSYEINTNSRYYGNKVETSGSHGYESSNVNFDSSIKIGVVPSTTRIPIYKSSSASSGQSLPSRRPSYSLTTPTVTTYSGGYSRDSSTSSYEVSTAKSVANKMGRGKVIVKFSDLHPLLLGKLGAECTCKADPFANFRDGKKPLPINSSKGRVDLRNYDESEIYVDLESSRDNGDYDSAEYITNLGDSTGDNYDDGKYVTPVVARFDGVDSSTKGAAAIKSRKPSSTYLPVSSTTYAPSVSSTKRPFSSTYLPARSLDNVKVASSSNDGVSVSASFVSARGGGFRAGKNLRGSGQISSNGLAGQGATFDRYGPDGLRGADETLQGTSDCAKPGLFRHPNYCNKFYACHWDEWKKKFTLHVLNCPVHLTFDSGAGACNWPSKGPACQDDNLLV